MGGLDEIPTRLSFRSAADYAFLRIGWHVGLQCNQFLVSGLLISHLVPSTHKQSWHPQFRLSSIPGLSSRRRKSKRSPCRSSLHSSVCGGMARRLQHSRRPSADGCRGSCRRQRSIRRPQSLQPRLKQRRRKWKRKLLPLMLRVYIASKWLTCQPDSVGQNIGAIADVPFTGTPV